MSDHETTTPGLVGGYGTPIDPPDINPPNGLAWDLPEEPNRPRVPSLKDVIRNPITGDGVTFRFQELVQNYRIKRILNQDELATLISQAKALGEVRQANTDYLTKPVETAYCNQMITRIRQLDDEFLLKLIRYDAELLNRVDEIERETTAMGLSEASRRMLADRRSKQINEHFTRQDEQMARLRRVGD